MKIYSVPGSSKGVKVVEDQDIGKEFKKIYRGSKLCIYPLEVGRPFIVGPICS